MADIVLINPRFDASFWGMEHAMPLFGKRAAMPVACLPLLAALTPAEHQVTLIDENVEPLDFERIGRADIVGVTGIVVQRRRMREILAELKKRHVLAVVGGSWITVREDYFGDLPDVIFVGEADETWPEFLADWKQGKQRQRYEQAAKSDMTHLPTPRFDLLKFERYMFGTVQFSRGCPFQCEFCDIIVIFGRRPRFKTSSQMIAELEAIRAQGVRLVFIVDDNLIGNKKAVKDLLHDLIAWQRAQGYPLRLFTEASIDLAEDDELMRLMAEANIVSVFIGIETPNEDSLRETRKFQNIKETSLVDRVHAIQQAGIEVWCGLIAGFDHDDQTVFERHRRFLEQARIADASLGLLYAIPRTPLYDRLAAEGRLDHDDEPEFGTNVVPLGVDRAWLRDTYVSTMSELYQPAAYFARMESLFLDKSLNFEKATASYYRRHRLQWLKTQLFYMLACVIVITRMWLHVHDPGLRREYARRLWRFAQVRHTPDMIFRFLIRCARHYHLYRMAELRARESRKLYSTF